MGEGLLGTGLDVLALVVTGGLALPTAIETVYRWCTTPGRRNAQINLSVGAVTVTVTASASAEELAAMTAALTAALETTVPGEDPSDSGPQPQPEHG
ncbi:hypothetical protein [Streptomyces sp. NBC_01615]|uniref:effector-associated constant component EACC1 n=1 Tax=Streptomyces sp. NBC_01615 TaxID=2975898 RepID=UPI00386B6BB1